ncbi:hypothetical protein EON67_04410 [archaeon]|nr:MAG: hypothetical protein EON67_04410 [archaeon]
MACIRMEYQNKCRVPATRRHTILAASMRGTFYARALFRPLAVCVCVCVCESVQPIKRDASRVLVAHHCLAASGGVAVSKRTTTTTN